jgi:hypothetical protein
MNRPLSSFVLAAFRSLLMFDRYRAEYQKVAAGGDALGPSIEVPTNTIVVGARSAIGTSTDGYFRLIERDPEVRRLIGAGLSGARP